MKYKLGLAGRFLGKCHVVYPCGHISVGLKKRVAKGYKEIFGGRLVRSRSLKNILISMGCNQCKGEYKWRFSDSTDSFICTNCDNSEGST